MRLIDVDKLYPDCLTNDGRLAISQSQIANAPTVDPDKPLFSEIVFLERPQGEWKIDSIGVYCSECHKHPDYSSDFCPFCGADMKGGAE